MLCEISDLKTCVVSDVFVRPNVTPAVRTQSSHLTPLISRPVTTAFDRNCARFNTTGHSSVRLSFLKSLSADCKPNQRNAEASRSHFTA